MAEAGEDKRPGRPVRRNYVFRAAHWLKDAETEIGAAYGKGDLPGLSRLLVRRLGLGTGEGAPEALPLQITHRPLQDWDLYLPGDRPTADALPGQREKAADAALAIRFPSEEAAEAFRTKAEAALGPFDEAVGDIRIRPALHWGPGRGEGDAFGGLEDALRLIRADALAAGHLDGSGVKVVVIDQGVDASRLPPGTTFLGGWWKPSWPGAVPPGQAAKDNRHGTMIARNVLALAPKAMILDCPLIPPRITANLPAFLSDAFGAITRIALDIVLLGLINPKVYKGRWVLVNAWSIYDPRGEAYPGEYTKNRYHWVACAVDIAAKVADVVFAAGNCGQFCPDGRCAEEVIGPGRSILGANSLDSVLTVGAVRADGIWNGYSSQGPGQFSDYLGQPQLKPDLAAPAHFRVPDTAHRLAAGSSAASAIAAGAVAALRTKWDDTALPSDVLFDRLRQSAWQPDGSSGWNERHGHGILDCRAALASLAGVPVP
nr:S8 family serine peptidase [Neoroseomonas soli]